MDRCGLNVQNLTQQQKTRRAGFGNERVEKVKGGRLRSHKGGQNRER